MSETEAGRLGPKEKIQILLEEYKSLRAETSARVDYSFKVIAIGAAAITWAYTQPGLLEHRFWVIAGIVLFIVAAVLIIGIRDVWRLAERLRELEQEINSRAGAHLLVWERLWSPGARSYGRALFSSRKVLDRSTLPPLDHYDD